MPSSRPALRRRRFALAIGSIVLVLAGAACGAADTSSPAGGNPSGSQTPVSSAPLGTVGGSSPTPVATGDPEAVVVELEPVVGGLDDPVLATNADDGSGRIFVLEQGGRIRIVQDGVLLEEPLLDIRDRVGSGGERGLLGLAFHPEFGEFSHTTFYVNYTDLDGHTNIAAFDVGSDPNVADPNSERRILLIEQPFANHNGGMIAFGPDGMLYIGMGDGGSGGDPMDNGQRLDTRLGKMLRIDVVRPGDRPYVAPADNPYIDEGETAADIWSVGLRNPWRFSFDRTTGQLWIGDVGQNEWEEVHRAPEGTGRGANYGWRLMEGRHCFEPERDCEQDGLVLPVAEYDHGSGCTVVGGYVYRGEATPALAGTYLFADYCDGTIWGIASDGPDEQEPVVLAETDHAISSFGEDESGELYVTDRSSGELLHIVATGR